MFDTKQAIFLNGVVSFHKRFEIERFFLLRGQRNWIECSFPCRVLPCVKSAKKMPHPCSISTILYEPRDSMLNILQMWQVACIIFCVAIQKPLTLKRASFQEGELSASLSRVKEPSD